MLAAVLALVAASANANINVELRPPSQTVNVGNTANVGVYVVSDNEGNQLMSAADILFGWQTAFLQLSGNSNAGAVALLSSGFPTDPFNVNESVPPADGTGLYQAFAFLGSPVAATPTGTLLTTLQFQALNVTVACSPVPILPAAGSPLGHTVVYDGTVPNTDVTGTLTGACVNIVPEPAGLCLVGLAALLPMRRRRIGA